MRRVRSLLPVLAVLTLAACRGKRQPPAEAAGADPTAKAAAADPLPWCLTSLERIAGLPPNQRAGAIVRACPLCGDGFDPLLAADRAITGGTYSADLVWTQIAACGGACSSTATASFRAALTELGVDHPTVTPWRTLALACPATMHADRETARFASGAWYALATIAGRLTAARTTLPVAEAAKLDAALTDLVMPLPPRTMTGNPLVLASGAQDQATPWLALSIVGGDVYVGRLPFARLGAGGLTVVGRPLYPGTIVALPALAAAVATELGAGPGFAVPTPPGLLDRPVVLAGSGAPAARVLELVSALGAQATTLAVTSPAPASMWPGQLAGHPVPMAARDPVRAPHLRVALTSARVAAIDAAGKVVASAALPGPDQPMAARLYAAAAAMAPGGVVEVVAEAGTVADLAALLDAALRGGASGVIPAAAATVTGRARPVFDGPALRALVTPP